MPNITKKIILLLLFSITTVVVILVSLPKQNKGLSASQENSIISGSFDKNKLKSDDEWKKLLTTDEYNIVREKGTEVPFTGALLHNTQKGTYVSVGCNEPVFRSEQKYDSGTGWPSFWAPINKDALVLIEDKTFGQTRIEVQDKCGGHLGHVFDDGPDPTGKRYCMNSLALKFIPDKNQ